MKRLKRVLSMLLCMAMMLTSMPLSAFATEKTDTVSDTLEAALNEAKTYIDALTINNTSNDPETVVSNYGKQFSWDNEKRESNSRDYLYDWSYYNGVVFEGLEYVYEVTKEEEYKDYVVDYMSSLINSNGEWTTCSNNSSKKCAGYVDNHGADCYKTASLLLDAYEMTNDSRYLTMANTLYADLDYAANSYSLSNAGNNYRHTWASDPSPDLWLDGLYMILPFRAEYAKYINDTEELDLIVDRMQWVSDNMYNESKGLFYHAADSASSNSGTYWLRSIGWYAAAIADIMDSMEGENLEAMKNQLVKLVDGMKATQNSSNGMWLNNLAASESSSNPYETSGTALICYAVMKAVNEGWLDASYADMAIKAFNGICNEKLDGTTLKDICFKGAPGSSNSTFYDNEGKGVGPFIMLYAEVLEYQDSLKEESEVTPTATPTPEQTPEDVTDEATGITVAGSTATDMTVVDKTSDEAIVAALKNVVTNFVAYDITLDGYTQGTEVTLSLPIPDGVAAENAVAYYVPENDVPVKMDGQVDESGKNYVFNTNHFSVYTVGEDATKNVVESVSGTGNLVGGTVYTLDTDGVDAGKKYLIVNTGSDETGYALTNNSGSAGRTPVTVSNSTITVEDDANIAWTISGSASGTVGNNGRYVYPNWNSLSLNTSGTSLTIGNQGDGTYRLYYSQTSGSWWTYYYYLGYNNNAWTGSSTNQVNNIASVYLYNLTSSSAGEEVVFTITPGSVNLKTKNTQDLTGIVTVAGKTVDLSDCTIEWISSDKTIATINNNGTVTAVAEGRTNITATLSAVNGTALQKNIVLTVPVTVQNKTVSSAVLTGNEEVTTRQNVEPDFSNIKLEVTYDDGTTGTITVDNGLVIEGYDITTIGSSYATISYAGKEYGNVRVTVEGNPYEGVEDATEYPEYPADGAVRIDKTATTNAETFKNTGVTHVELDVAGISVKRAVDVILVTDLSNSMAWAAGGRTDATSHEATKVYDLQQSVASFADIFLASDDEGNATENTISLVTFGGYDADHTKTVYTAYADPTQTLLVGTNDANIVKNTVNDIRVLADDALNIGTSTTGYYLSFDGGATYGENYGNTNYDHAFMQTADAISALKTAYQTKTGVSYDESGRQIYVLFMTDGAPSNYDGVYYNYKTGDRADVNCTWVNASGEEVTYTMGNNRAQYGEDAWFQYIAGGTYNSTTDTIPGNPLYWADEVYNTTSVADIYNIGFDLDNGGFSSMTFTQADGRPLSKVLENLVTDETLEVYSADDAGGLNQIYADLATKIRYAGTSAQVEDVIDSDFTLQMSSTSGSGDQTADLGSNRTITVTTYDLWTKAETTDTTLIGTRKETSQVLETVTFNADGTEAYSDKVENSTKNILSTADDGTITIEAHYFTYTKTSDGIETFKWAIGNITDKEIVLGFDVYLKGSLEGEREEGIYYTNEKATLEYIDIEGYHATQTFPVPAVSWGGATTTIRFYLVNEKGEPVNHAGVVVPWANRVYVGDPVIVPLNLNADITIPAQEIKAATYVPDEYFLYDVNSSYTVQTASGTDNTINGGITISDPSKDASKTTYDNLGNAITQTGEQTTKVIEAEATYYTWSTVGFGVRYDLSTEKVDVALEPDKIVIDYGKAIQVDVLANDAEEIASGFTGELVGFVAYNGATNTQVIQHSAGTAPYSTKNGTYSIVKEKVQFQLTTMLSEVEKVFCVVKITETEDTTNYYYLYEELDIIPATNVYYETDFAEGIFTTITGAEGETWSTVKVEGDLNSDTLQDDGTIGFNQIYGYDSSYTNDKYLSNGSSLKVTGEGVDITRSLFSFTGTGFDLISRTGTDQGAIRVDIYTDAARTHENKVKSVSVLNKSESDLELYQIPVVSVNNLTYGTYYVTIGVNAAYKNESYPSLKRGGEFYFDAIRIYNPARGNTEAEVAYVADGEASPVITEVRAQLVTKDDYDITDTVNLEGMAFVDRVTEESHDVNVATYETIGPNNEVYLSKGQGIAFEISATADIASIDIGAKAPNSKAAQLTANISDTADTVGTGIQKNIESATPQYFDLMENPTTDLATIFKNGKAYVIIKNTGDGVLSITDIKIGYGAVSGTVSYMVTRSTVDYANTVADAENTVATPNYNIKSAEFVPSTCNVFGLATLKVVTTTDVEKLSILSDWGLKAYPTITSKVNENGEKEWTVSMRMYILGNRTYTITGYGADGTAGELKTADIGVYIRTKKF